jgi:hypothetical protein
MFDASLCAASDLQEMSVLCRRLVACRLEDLRRLGYARDLDLLFFANDTCRPCWELVDDLDADAQKIIREIFDYSHSAGRANDELAFRARPN